MGSVGWYHSHPGYGCWMSGIDVGTERQGQMMDPYMAIVVDPMKTMASGRVEIGGFRTYPLDYVPPNSEGGYQSVPQEKLKDWGLHANDYYKLKAGFIQSSTDKLVLKAMKQKFWVNTVSSTVFILV